MSKDSETPLVSIGLPVYNGERYIRAALDCLLAQDYPRLEIHVCDNASTDATPEICREYLGRDERLRYHPSDRNRGVVWNFNRCARLAAGPFFMWHGVKDLRHPTFVRRCVERLAQRPEAVLCYTYGGSLNEDGSPGDLLVDERYGTEATPAERVRGMLANLTYSEAQWGVIRTAALRRSGVMPVNVLPDVTLLTALAILGPFECIPEPLHSLRWREEETWEQYSTRSLDFISDRVGPLHRRFPATKCALDQLRVCLRVPRTAAERLQCLRWYLKAFPWVQPAGLKILEEWPSGWIRPMRRAAQRSRRAQTDAEACPH